MNVVCRYARVSLNAEQNIKHCAIIGALQIRELSIGRKAINFGFCNTGNIVLEQKLTIRLFS